MGNPLSTTDSGNTLKTAIFSGYANDVGAFESDFNAWIVSNKAVKGGYEVYKYTNEFATGAGVRISSAPGDNCWMVDANNGLFQFDGKNWIKQSIAAKDVSVNQVGTVWIISAEADPGNPGNYNVYQLNGTTWQKVWGSGIRISVDIFNFTWMINTNNDLYRYDYYSGLWTKQDMAAKDIGFSLTDGSGWCISTDEDPLNPGNYFVYHWINSMWTKLNKSGVVIALDPLGKPWVVNSSQRLSEYVNDLWYDRGIARDVGITPTGIVWTISNTPVAGGYKIAKIYWKDMNFAGLRIAAAPNGEAWLANSTNSLYKFSNNNWAIQSITAKDVGVGANGKVCVISAEADPGNPGNYNVYQLNGTKWQKVAGRSGIRITVDFTGHPWLVNTNYNLYYYNSGWILQYIAARDVGAGADGTVWIISNEPDPSCAYQYLIYKNLGATWRLQTGTGTSICVDKTGNPWSVNAYGMVYQYINFVWIQR